MCSYGGRPWRRSGRGRDRGVRGGGGECRKTMWLRQTDQHGRLAIGSRVPGTRLETTVYSTRRWRAPLPPAALPALLPIRVRGRPEGLRGGGRGGNGDKGRQRAAKGVKGPQRAPKGRKGLQAWSNIADITCSIRIVSPVCKRYEGNQGNHDYGTGCWANGYIRPLYPEKLTKGAGTQHAAQWSYRSKFVKKN